MVFSWFLSLLRLSLKMCMLNQLGQEFTNFQLMEANKISAMQKRIAATWVIGDAYEDNNE